MRGSVVLRPFLRRTPGRTRALGKQVAQARLGGAIEIGRGEVDGRGPVADADEITRSPLGRGRTEGVLQEPGHLEGLTHGESVAAAQPRASEMNSI